MPEPQLALAGEPARTQGLELALALALVLELVTELAAAVGLVLALASELALALEFWSELAAEITQAPEPVLELTLQLARAFDLVLELNLSLELSLELSLARELVLELVLALTLTLSSRDGSGSRAAWSCVTRAGAGAGSSSVPFVTCHSGVWGLTQALSWCQTGAGAGKDVADRAAASNSGRCWSWRRSWREFQGFCLS